MTSLATDTHVVNSCSNTNTKIIEDHQQEMVSVDPSMLLSTMKSSSSPSKSGKNNANGLKWRWKKIKEKIHQKNNENGCDGSNNSVSTGVMTMTTKATLEDDYSSRVDEMSFCSSTMTHDASTIALKPMVTSDDFKSIYLLMDSSQKSIKQEEPFGEYLTKDTSRLEFETVSDNENPSFSTNNTLLEGVSSILLEEDELTQDLNDVAANAAATTMDCGHEEQNEEEELHELPISNEMVASGRAEIFSFSDVTTNISTATTGYEDSICDYRYIGRTKSFMGSESIFSCAPSVKNSNCSYPAIEDSYNNTFPVGRRFRFPSTDRWNFGNTTSSGNYIIEGSGSRAEISGRSLLDDDDEDEGSDCVDFLPIQDDDHQIVHHHNHRPIVAVASNIDGGIEAVDFGIDTVTSSISFADDDIINNNSGRSHVIRNIADDSLEYQDSSFFHCGLDFCQLK